MYEIYHRTMAIVLGLSITTLIRKSLQFLPEINHISATPWFRLDINMPL